LGIDQAERGFRETADATTVDGKNGIVAHTVSGRLVPATT
jgi:hypothetical protein